MQNVPAVQTGTTIIYVQWGGRKLRGAGGSGGLGSDQTRGLRNMGARGAGTGGRGSGCSSGTGARAITEGRSPSVIRTAPRAHRIAMKRPASSDSTIPDSGVETCVEGWLRNGGTHHEVINLGDRSAAWKMLCGMLGVEYVEV